MSRFVPLALLATVSGCCCGNTSMTLAVSPDGGEVNDGNTATQVSATVMVAGQPAADGTAVSFTVQSAANSSSSTTIASFQPLTGQPQSSGSALTTNGVASINLYDFAVETVVVTANTQAAQQGSEGASASAVPLTATIDVQFGGQCPGSFISKKPPSLATGVPATLTFTCQSNYMGGIFPWDSTQLFAGDSQTCQAIVNDASGQSVDGAPIQFLGEAGTFDTNVQQPGQHPTVLTDATGTATVTLQSTQPYPLDVDPNQFDSNLLAADGELVKRAWTDSDGHTYNPRDGWVSLIAATPGLLPKGVDGGYPEPFVDSNDNGTYDPPSEANPKGEPYIDVNCNGQWDGAQTPDANGLVRLWTPLTIVWTDTFWDAQDCEASNATCTGSGYLYDTPEPGCSENIVSIQPCNQVFRFVDKNLNLIATFSDSTVSASIASGNASTSADIPVNSNEDVSTLVHAPDFPIPVTPSGTTAGPWSLDVTANFTVAGAGSNPTVARTYTSNGD